MCSNCSIREYLNTTVAQIIIMVDVLLEYIDLQSFQSSTAYYAGIMLDAFSYLYAQKLILY